MSQSRLFTGDLIQVQTAIYDLATQVPPSELLSSHQGNALAAALELASGLDFTHAEWLGQYHPVVEVLREYFEDEFEDEVDCAD
jgi:hypothetical protein